MAELCLRTLYHGCNDWTNQISCLEVNKCDIYLQTRYIILIYTSRQLMFTVDINDGQWLKYMCTQILNAFTINKVGMHVDVVVANGGGASCDVDGRIWSTLSRYCGWVILECGTLAGARWDSSLRLRAAWAHTCMPSSFHNG